MDVFGQSADALLLTFFTDLEVEKYHFGKEGSGACPNEIKDIVHHLRQK
jgi:choline transporter-like protein 2/4/5